MWMSVINESLCYLLPSAYTWQAYKIMQVYIVFSSCIYLIFNVIIIIIIIIWSREYIIMYVVERFSYKIIILLGVCCNVIQYALYRFTYDDVWSTENPNIFYTVFRKSRT